MDSVQLRDEIARVLESGSLSSALLRRMLQYLGDAAANGKGDVKEYTIGVDALGKSPSYDPQRDSTVRVQVGKLRQKLDEYYREEGSAHPVRLILPKGTFRLQLESQPDAVPIPPIRPRIPKSLLLVLAGLLIGAIAYTLGNRKAAQTSTAGLANTWTPELRLLWQPILGNSKPIVISYDTAMTIDIPPWRLRHPEINEPEEIEAARDWQQLSNKLGHPAFQTDNLYVGFGIAHGTFLLGQLLSTQALRPTVKRSTVLSWEDMTHSHLIFVGSGKTSKIIRSILRRGDFDWDSSQVSSKIVNLRPLPGESAEFHQLTDPHTGAFYEQYALISMLPSFDENTRVFVLGGGTSEGDWAVTAYVTAPDHVQELVRHMKTKFGDLPKAFQVVVRIKYQSRVPISMAYVTHHALSLPAVLQRESEGH